MFDHPGMAGGEFSDDDDGDGMMGGVSLSPGFLSV